MSYIFKVICRNFSLFLMFLLMLQAAHPQYNFKRVDDWLSNNLEDLGGRAVMVVYKDGKIIYSKAQNEISKKQERLTKFIAKRKGKDATELLQDFNLSTQQMVASCSKWLSAALVMTFIDEGKLSLNDTIGKFLPVLLQNGKGNITIGHCLSHLTGIVPGSLKESREMITNAPSMEESIELIAKQPMEGAPGKTFHYSNVGLQLAAAIIEKIGNKDFETLFQERIAKPCNMINTNFGNGKTVLAAGSARSTPLDYLNFLTMILNEGSFNGKKVLSKNAIIEMQMNRVNNDTRIVSSPAEAGNWGYGFGEWVMDDVTGEKRSNAVTSPGLFGSFPWIDNEKKYAGFLFVFNIKNKGRNEKYKELKQLTDMALTK